MSAGVRGRMHAATMLVSVFLLLIGLPLLVAGVVLPLRDILESRELDTYGRPTTGHVVDKSIHVDRTTSGGASYHLAYRFVSDQGGEIAATANVDPAVWNRLRPGDAIEVRYLAAEPSTHRVEGEQMALLLPVVLIVTGTFLVLPGAVLARLAVRKPADERRDRPRGVILTSRPVLLAGLPLLVVGVPFLLAGAYQVAERGAQGAALETGGQRVDGTVLTKAIATERTRSRTSGTRSTTRHHRVTYRYRTLDGQQVVGTADLAPAAWGRLQERGPIGVVYLPQTPWLHRVDGEGDARIGFLVMATFGLISTAVGAVLLVIGLRRPRLTLPRIFAGTRRADVVPAPEPSPPALERPAPERRNWVAPVVGGVFLVAGVALLVSGIGQWIEERELSATGRLAEGHVVAKTIERAGSGDGARTRYLAAYRFQTDDGEAFEGAYELAVDAWEALEAGAPVSVRYLPGDPGENRPANVSATGEIVVALLLGPVAAGIGGATLYFTLRRRLSAPHRN